MEVYKLIRFFKKGTGCLCEEITDFGVIPCPVALLQAEAAGPERRLDGDVQGGVRCVVSAGSVRGMQTKR